MKPQLKARRRLPDISKVQFSKKLYFTKRTELQSEYYRVRKACYRMVENGPVNFIGDEDCYDRQADILVIQINGRIVGGARLVGSTPENRILLPVEQEGFLMQQIFPDFELENKSYCEFGRIAILPEYRSKNLIDELCAALIGKAIKKGYEYQFSMAPIIQTRCYRRVSCSLKLPYPYVIHKDISVPKKAQDEVGDLKMYLGSLRLPQPNRTNMGQTEQAISLYKTAA